jgi:predicted RNase H-like HicB family nuclease
MKDYAINVFWSDEDESYIATVPDLRGCSAFGESPEEAVREVQIAKRLWLESAQANGDPVPEPLYRPGEPPRTAAG